MYLIETPYFALQSSLGVESKRSLPKNLDIYVRSFDENVLRRLKALTTASNPPSISLSWLSSAVDFLTSIHDDAKNLISNLSLSGSLEDSLGCYLDDSVKLLDVCNSISSEIGRLRQCGLKINFALYLLKSSEEGSQISESNLHRAKAFLADWGNCTSGYVKRGFQIDSDASMRDLAASLAKVKHSKITSVNKLVRRTIFAVQLVSVFVIGSIRSALYGKQEIIRVRIPTEFAWADSFNALEWTISGALTRRFTGVENKGKFVELNELEIRVRKMSDAFNDVSKLDDIKRCVEEVETAKVTYWEGLDSLTDGVNKLFDTVMRTRDGMLETFRVGHEQQKEK